MIRWSLLAGLVGVLASRVATARLGRSDRSPELYWVLGLVGVLPAWFLAFVPLLGPSVGRGSSPAFWILSSAAGLLGVILTDRVVQHRREAVAEAEPAYWLLGVAAVVPAWGIALLALAAL